MKEKNNKEKKEKRGRGRPRKDKVLKHNNHKTIPIDWEEVKYAVKCGASGAAIARSLGICPETLHRRCKEDIGLIWSDYKSQHSATGEMELSKAQHEFALRGNIALLIFLGKNRLGQSDKVENKHFINNEPANDKVNFNDINKATEAYTKLTKD